MNPPQVGRVNNISGERRLALTAFHSLTSRCQVNSMHWSRSFTLWVDYLFDTVEETLVFGVGWSLVMNEFNLGR